jgi:porin
MAGIYNGDATIRANDKNGADLTMHGPVFAIAEADYKYDGLPGDGQYLGNYKLGAWYDDNIYTNYTSVGYAAPAASRRGNWGVYGLFDQVIWPFAEPFSNRGLGVFGSLLVSPDQTVSQLPYFFTAGFACRGISASRPTDVLGAGVIFGEFSNDIRHAEERQQLLVPAPGVQNNETVFELTYRLNLARRAVFFQPDLQYIIHPGGTERYRDALVIGCQVGINF